MDPRSSDEATRRDIPSFIEPRPPLIYHPFMRPRPEKGINLLERFEEDSHVEDGPELVQVYLRLKPCKIPSNLYELRSDKCLVTSLDTATAGHGRRTQHNVSKMYTFSRIFNAECSQTEIFNEVVKDNLKRLVDGYSFTLLSYGASGSGKTYTIMGTVNSPGLVPRSLEYLFRLVEAAQTPIYKPSENGSDHLGYSQQHFELQWVKRLLQISAPFRDKYRRMSTQLHSDLTVSSVDLTSRTKHYVWVSFVEIYNEAIYDLLAPPDKRLKLRLREDSSGNVYVKGVTQAFVRSGEEAYDVMVAGKHNLVVAATGIHAHSSRSHCIFTITMLTEKDGEIHSSHVRLCDLAGCERQSAARNTGARMQESRAINSSLHVLERCLHMLRRKQHSKDAAVVPYRECKLTRLLGSGLSGARGEAVSMVVTLNPAPAHAHQTKHVLSLAVVAKDIQINNTIDPMATMSSLESTQNSTIQDNSQELMRLRTENERLQFELLQAQLYIDQQQKVVEETRQETNSKMQDVMMETMHKTTQVYEKQLSMLRAQMAEMEEDYERRLAEAEDQLRLLRELRARDNLDSCIEDKEENYREDRNSPRLDPLSDSENESENDVDLDESLEPVKQIRKSILHKEMPDRYEAVINLINESVEEFENESENYMVNDSTCVGNESKKVLADSSMAVSKDSMYATGDEDDENQTDIENASDLSKPVPVCKVNDKNITVEAETDNYLEDINVDKDKSECEEMFNVSNKFEIMKSIEKTVPENRGTYFIKSEPQIELNIDHKLKSLNTVRGTYYVADREMSFYKQTEVDIDNDKKKKESLAKNKEAPVETNEKKLKNMEPPMEIVKPKKLAETLVSKIMKAYGTRQSSESSLRQFEQLEQAVSNTNISTDAVKSLDITIPQQIIKKKTYFDDTINTTADIKSPNKEQNDNAKNDNIKSIYLENRPDEPAPVNCDVMKAKNVDEFHASNVSQLSNAAKLQEKRLLFDSPDNSSNSPEEENCHLEASKTMSIILTPKIVKEAQLYFTESDKVVFNDVLLSRSPSIVIDNIKQEYQPSIAMKKILGESFTKPEILSSVHKDRLAKSTTKTKHGSVDIFESPLSSITKVSCKDTCNIDMTDNNNTEPDTINKETVSDTNLKVNSNEIAQEFIESLVASQKIKEYIKREEIAYKSSLTGDRKHENTKENTVEIKQETTIERTNITEQPTRDSKVADIESKNEDSKEIKQKAATEGNNLTEKSTISYDNFTNKSDVESNVIDVFSSIEIKQESTIERTFITEPTVDYNYSNDSETTSKVANIEMNMNNNDTQSSNNTVDEFENIVKDLSHLRATEFEFLVSEEDLPLHTNIKQTREQNTDTKSRERRKKFEEAKYNLRNKKANIHTSEEKKGNTRSKTSNLNESEERKDTQEQIPECSKSKSFTKRSLRLRRRKNVEDTDSDMDKLKDIANLEKEFSDVTLGVPVVEKIVKDIPSPEKLAGEEENVPPPLGIQSCPSKSVIRSRRKLFTPRAEPLEESPGQAGDSNERICVPRPSFHRARARRRL